MVQVMRQPRKDADDYTRAEILAWIGAGPNRRGLWNLASSQVEQFGPCERGIVHANFRYTRWHIDACGVLRWEEAGRREYEEAQRRKAGNA